MTTAALNPSTQKKSLLQPLILWLLQQQTPWQSLQQNLPTPLAASDAGTRTSSGFGWVSSSAMADFCCWWWNEIMMATQTQACQNEDLFTSFYVVKIRMFLAVPALHPVSISFAKQSGTWALKKSHRVSLDSGAWALKKCARLCWPGPERKFSKTVEVGWSWKIYNSVSARSPLTKS